MNSIPSDVYQIVGVPKEFEGMSEEEFKEFLTQIPLGRRLTCFASWPERMFVSEFLEIINVSYNPFLSLEEDEEEENRRPTKPVSDRNRYIYLGLVRWFGTKVGRAWVEEIMKESDGQFFSLWDGKSFWYQGVKNKAYSLAQLLDSDPPPLLTSYQRIIPFPKPTQTDYAAVTIFIRWLSSDTGNLFVETVLKKIQAEFDRIAEEQSREREKARIDRDLEIKRAQLYQQAGIQPA